MFEGDRPLSVLDGLQDQGRGSFRIEVVGIEYYDLGRHGLVLSVLDLLWISRRRNRQRQGA